MGKALRNEELTVILACKLHCYMLTIGGTALTDVNSDIHNFSLNHSYEFALCIRWILEMESTQYAIMRETLVILNKIYPPHLFLKVTLGIALIKVATTVTKYFWLNNNHTGYFCIYNINHL